MTDAQFFFEFLVLLGDIALVLIAWGIWVIAQQVKSDSKK